MMTEDDIEERARNAERNASELLAQLAKRDEAAARAAQAQYRETVRKVVAGEPQIPDTVESILAASGKTTENLADDVDRLRDRRHWREQFDAGRAAEAEIKRCSRAVAEAEREFAEVFREHEANIARLVAERNAAVDTLSASFRAKTELLQSAGPQARGATDALDRRMEQLRREQPQLQHARDDKRRARDNWKQSDEATHYAADIERVGTELAKMESQLEAMRAEANAINDQYTNLELQFLLDPEQF